MNKYKIWKKLYIYFKGILDNDIGKRVHHNFILYLNKY